ncbi:hypothetical protein ACRALDRAFT_2056771 [Sodiomyces alcalophilus JCM 7366]|uniref:uncharacterized protein n=1 Tax=Sodiomyces alcalophilus JCM 7366 TaxID=591952 RepID=UPI0039B5AE67
MGDLELSRAVCPSVHHAFAQITDRLVSWIKLSQGLAVRTADGTNPLVPVPMQAHFAAMSFVES